MAEYNIDLAVRLAADKALQGLKGLEQNANKVANAVRQIGAQDFNQISRGATGARRQINNLYAAFQRLDKIGKIGGITAATAAINKFGQVLSDSTVQVDIWGQHVQTGIPVINQLGGAVKNLTGFIEPLTQFLQSLDANTQAVVAGLGIATAVTAAFAPQISGLGAQVRQAAESFEDLRKRIFDSITGLNTSLEVTQAYRNIIRSVTDNITNLSQRQQNAKTALDGLNSTSDAAAEVASTLVSITKRLNRETSNQITLIKNATAAQREFNDQARVRANVTKSAFSRGESGFAAFSQAASRIADENAIEKSIRRNREKLQRAAKPLADAPLMLPSSEMLNAAGRGIQQLSTYYGDLNTQIDTGVRAGQDFTAQLIDQADRAQGLPPIFNQVGAALETTVAATSKGNQIQRSWTTAINDSANNIRQLNAEEEQRLITEREISFEKRLQARLDKNANDQAKKRNAVDKQRSGIASSAVIGGAFPLLFGQGAGAALGGAIGGGIGARFGQQGGFGGSLVGTFAGQATIDFAINSAVQLAKALQKPTENIQELIKFLGVAGTEFDANVQVLQKLGMESTASAIALAKLEDVLKAEGYKNIDTLSEDLRDLENAFSRLKLAAANILAEPLTKFLNWLTDTLKLMSKAGGIGGFITTSPTELQALDRQVQAERAAAEKVARTPGNVDAAAQKLITDEQNRQLGILNAQVALERDRLSLTRVALASRQGEIEIMRIGNELTKKATERQNEKNAAKQKELDLDIKLLQLQKQQAEEARKNAIIEAQRQVYRDITSQRNQQFTAQINYNNLLADSTELTYGELAGIKEKRDNLDKERLSRIGILYNEREMALLGVNELEVRKEIQKTYDGLASVLFKEIQNRQAALNQQEAQYNLTQLQIQQQRELNNLQTEGQMALEVAGLRAGVDPRFFGVFGGSARTQELMSAEMQLRMGELQRQSLNLESQLSIPGLAPARILELEQQSAALNDQISIYERYQPAVINATVAQQRFNEALAVTTPVVDSMFNSFMAVAEGTATAQQAFADFLRNIANMLFDVAKQLIAQYIAIGIARQFAGIPAAGGGGEAYTAAGNEAFMQRTAGLDLAGSLYTRANGGPVSAGTPYLVGERGPEMFVPRTSGSIYPNNAMGMGGANVTVNVDATGSSVEGSADQANQLGKAIGLAVQQELIKQKRPGGLLA